MLCNTRATVGKNELPSRKVICRAFAGFIEFFPILHAPRVRVTISATGDSVVESPSALTVLVVTVTGRRLFCPLTSCFLL
jgi:hypothetical protein